MRKKRPDNCLQEAVSIVTKRPLNKVPHFVSRSKGHWLYDLMRWCDRCGYYMLHVQGTAILPTVFDTWINIGPGLKSNPKSRHHAVVMKAKSMRHTANVLWDGNNPLRRVEQSIVIWPKTRKKHGAHRVA